MDRLGQSRYRLHVKVIKENLYNNLLDIYDSLSSINKFNSWSDSSSSTSLPPQPDSICTLRQFLVLIPPCISVYDLQHVISKQYQTMYSGDQINILILKDKHFSDLYKDFLVGDIFDPMDTVYAVIQFKKNEYEKPKSNDKKRKKEMNEFSESNFSSPQPQRFSKSLVCDLESSAKSSSDANILTAPPSGKSSSLGPIDTPILDKKTNKSFNPSSSSNLQTISKLESIRLKKEEKTIISPSSSSSISKQLPIKKNDFTAKTLDSSSMMIKSVNSEQDSQTRLENPKNVTTNIANMNTSLASAISAPNANADTIQKHSNSHSQLQSHPPPSAIQTIHSHRSFHEESSSDEEETQIIKSITNNMAPPIITKNLTDSSSEDEESSSEDEDKAAHIIKNKALTNISGKILSRPPSARPSPIASLPLNNIQKNLMTNAAKIPSKKKNLQKPKTQGQVSNVNTPFNLPLASIPASTHSHIPSNHGQIQQHQAKHPTA